MNIQRSRLQPKNHCFSFKFIYYHSFVGTKTKKTLQLLLETDLTVGNKYKIIFPQEVNDNSSPVQARTTKFWPELQNTLVKIPIV